MQNGKIKNGKTVAIKVTKVMTWIDNKLNKLMKSKKEININMSVLGKDNMKYFFYACCVICLTAVIITAINAHVIGEGRASPVPAITINLFNVVNEK